MKRKTVGFPQDTLADRVAELECEHRQHVPHDPPWASRPWVVTSEGRRSKLGAELDCRECDQGGGQGEKT